MRRYARGGEGKGEMGRGVRQRRVGLGRTKSGCEGT